LIIAVFAAVPPFITNMYYIQVLVFIGIYAILALSLNLLNGYVGLLSIGHAAFYAIGAYASAKLTMVLELPWVLAMAGSGAIAGVFGYGLVLAGLVYGHLGAASPLRRRSRLWAAAAISLVVVGTSAISDYAARSKFSTVMEYTGVLKPIDAAWVPATSVDAFSASAEKLKKELDGLTKKAKALQ